MTRITQRLDIRQGQQLVMTPQLQQAIKLLQLNNIELGEFVEEELAQNPLLEKAETETESDAPATEDPKEESDNIQENFDDAMTGGDSPDFDPGSSMASVGSGGDSRFEGIDEGFEDRISSEKTLRDHLTEQLYIAFNDNRDRVIGALLIDQIDEAGYLRTDPKPLAEQLGASLERVEKLLKKMKTFDPAGVFAADLSECLALQLKEKGTFDEPMQKLLANLKLVAEHEYKKLAALCGVNETYLRDMVEEIRALNPRPAAEFDHVLVQTAIPDVLMKRLPKNIGGGWRVELNSETLPKVLINQTYYTEVSKSATQKKDKEYLASQMNSASWLVRALDQRAQTILKVASEIVEQQDGFFNYGIEFLKPLTLKDIAEVIGMHESTVSRVTNNKFIGTPRGIFELKFFFSTALESEDGSSHSAESVKARIKALIEAESPEKVLSDDSIVEILKSEGIDLARRTVAKYREGLNIPSSILRRR
ncbi:MAG: RNA polymerase factor sigma-54, partial [Alphaproteobacteria bacterium]